MTPQQRRLRALALAAWAALVVSYLAATLGSGRTPLDVLIAVVTFLREHPLGPVVYLLAYAARPLVLFSAGLLSIAAGLLYGPAVGVALVVLGANASAVVAYGLGRGLGADLAGAALQRSRLGGMVGRLRSNAFEAVLTLRFVFAPYDAVNYLAGALRLPLAAFTVATVVGSLPGTLVFVLFGAGLGDLGSLQDGALPRPDAALLTTSALLLLLSLGLARVWRRRDARRHPAGGGAGPTE